MNDIVGPGREYGDAEIMKITGKLTDGEKIKLTINLPISGDELESEWIHNEKLKGGVLIAWCQTVRDQIDARFSNKIREQREQTLQREHQSMLSESPGTAAGQDKQSSSAVGVATAPAMDPTRFIKQQLSVASQEYTDSVNAQKEANIRALKASDSLHKWEGIAKQLGISLAKEESEEDEPEMESKETGRETESTSGTDTRPDK